MPRGACPEKWLPENPDVLRRIQLSYVKAGSDAVLTPTFGANSPSLKKHGVNGSVGEVNRRLGEISHGIADYTGGDMSPTGLFIEPFGEASFEEIAAFYREQAAALEGSVDFFDIETMINLCELKAAVIGIRDVSDKPVFATLTVDKNGRTMSGDALDAAILTLSEAGVNAFGCNCSVGPRDMLNALRPIVPLSAALGVPLIAKPNAGMPHECEDGSQRFDMPAAEFGAVISELLNAGIYILGGCCGTDELYIAEIKKRAAAELSFDTPAADISRLCCTNKAVAEYAEGSEIIEVTEDITDDFEDCGDEVPALSVSDIDAAAALLEAAPFFSRPFALTGDDEAVSLVRRRYCGRFVRV